MADVPQGFKKKTPEELARIREAFEAALNDMSQNIDGAEGFLITLHVARAKPKRDKSGDELMLDHYFTYEDFKHDDWGICMVEIGVEGKRAQVL